MRIALRLFSMLVLAAATPAFSAAVSHEWRILPIDHGECMRRADRAFAAEGYASGRSNEASVLGSKGIHQGYIACHDAPNNRVVVNIFMSSDAQDGTVPGRERVALMGHMMNPPRSGTATTGGDSGGGGWTTWLNRDDPGASGDWERVEDHASSIPCQQVSGIECRARDGRTGQRYKCSLDSPNAGFVCLNADNPGGCADYEVRFRCGGGSGAASGQTGASGAAGTDCAPTNPIFEYAVNRYGNDYRNFELDKACPELCAQQCENDNRCKAWTFVRPGVQGAKARCWLKDKEGTARRDNDTVSGTYARIIDRVPPVVGATPTGGQWSDWLNRDDPSASGDWERVEDHTASIPCKQPSAIECRARDGRTGQRVKCSLDSPNAGFVCLNADNPGGCADYEVRFRCGGSQSAGVQPQSGPVEDCPLSFSQFRGAGRSLTCRCSANAITSGAVWGSDIYTDDSSICRAALHSGATGANGGVITVQPLPGQNRYQSTERNGVTTSSWAEYPASFRVTRGQ